MNTQKEIEFFDRFEEKHADYDVLGEGAYRRLLALFQRQIAPRPGQKCIDLGCGTGAFTRRLLRFELDVTGLDISPRSVDRANRQAGKDKYIVGDIRQTQLPAGGHDIIVYSGVLHHCTEESTRIEVLREGYRLLRPGGRLFAFDPSAHSPSMWLYRNPRSPLYSDKGKTENEVLLNRQALAAEISQAGFASVAIRGVGGITFRYIDSRLARLLLPLYNTYEQLIRFSPLENLLGTFLVSVAVKPGGRS